jgi:hypothetical protein
LYRRPCDERVFFSVAGFQIRFRRVFIGIL